jgi:hypothetical protein
LETSWESHQELPSTQEAWLAWRKASSLWCDVRTAPFISDVLGYFQVPHSVDPDRFIGTAVLGDSWSGPMTVTPPTDFSQGAGLSRIFHIISFKRRFFQSPFPCFRTDALEHRLGFTCLSPNKPHLFLGRSWCISREFDLLERTLGRPWMKRRSYE